MNTVSVTPLLGGSEDGAVCSLLEFGGKRILLDCGSNYIIDSNYQSLLLKIANDLKNSGGVDALIISHADMHHIGSMPFLLGREGMSGVPIICTLPVYKFGQILLYDHCANGTMEDVNNIHNYEYEDIDEAFANVHTVKYSQVLDLNVICNSNINSNSIDATEPEISVINSAKRAPVTICAYPSGRTVGGAIWRISYGPAEILYAMDMNLKKEIVLDSVKMDLLPSGPALMIVEGPHPYQGVAKGTKKRKDKDESAAMLNSIMETLRSNGNVLIPCETSGRTLELLQILGKYWYENKLGLYQLFFLSHMSKNLPEFAQMQLEWMSDALSKQFYNGKPNPFELPQVKFITSSREIEKFPGPKVVLATDSSLSYGLAKEVLLMWGGDPRCRVIFTDIGSNGGNSSGDTSSGQIPSLALEIIEKYSTPPIICTITRPLKVELVGEELLEYQKEMEKVRKEQEEELQKKRRRDELSQVLQG